MSVPQKLVEFFRDVFELDDSVDVEKLEYRDVPQWDSVGHMRLIAAIEQHYEIMLDTDDVLDLSSLAKAVEILRKYNVDPSA
jgi:acyl carrier protein